VDFDPDDGTILSRETVQGFADESTWARGQAWGLHGFTITYRETGELRFLATAQALADWFIGHLPADSVPYWDFDAPDIPDEPRDSSAAAIAASGLLELSQLATDPADREIYLGAAQSILASLMSGEYLSDGEESSGILLHSTGNKPESSQVDVSLIYGDYYFTEALIRYLAVTACPWDVNGNGVVNVVDFLTLLQAWGPNPGHPADLDGDGEVNAPDFLALLEHWGECP
jgi:unsaturated chondroitin disaccharide hydrolase